MTAIVLCRLSITPGLELFGSSTYKITGRNGFSTSYLKGQKKKNGRNVAEIRSRPNSLGTVTGRATYKEDILRVRERNEIVLDNIYAMLGLNVFNGLNGS